MGLRGYIAKRIVYMAILLIAVMTVNFIIFMIMPGDPANMFINPMRRNMSEADLREQKERLESLWGINEPPIIRYFKYLRNMITWNFGVSVMSWKPVANDMVWRIPFTLLLLGGSGVLAILIGVVLGALAAYKRGGNFDAFAVVSSLVFFSLPTFWMGLVFILIFYSNLHWFPHAHAFPSEWALNAPHPFNMTTTSTNPLGLFVTVSPNDLWAYISGIGSHLFLPMLTLVLFQYGGFLLLARATMIESLTEDYIVTARAKGVSERNVVFRHALKNASLPLITAAALHFGFILSGAIITEGVYSWPGLGRWIFDSIGFKDYNVLQAVFYVIALCVIIANFVSDLLYGIIDPRIKY
jgi:peptide/nickel transport system permease protein